MLGLVGAGAAVFYVVRAIQTPSALASDTFVIIPKGAGLRDTAAQMTTLGVAPRPELFMAGAVLMHQNHALKAGEYLIPAHATMQDVIKLVASGRVYQRKFTVPEGLTVKEIVDALNTAPAMTGTIATIPVEGTLMPDTYDYQYGTERAAILKRMEQAMTDTVNALWAARDPSLPYKSPQEGVTMASIVERETAVPAERARVAGVFVNRLRQKIKLQTDPSVIYAATGGLSKQDHPILQSELSNPSPYNTYMHEGLPPTPICNPGRAALEAAFKPEAHKYLFFVANGTGGHAFAETLGQHNSNVTNWRKQAPAASNK